MPELSFFLLIFFVYRVLLILFLIFKILDLHLLSALPDNLRLKCELPSHCPAQQPRKLPTILFHPGPGNLGKASSLM